MQLYQIIGKVLGVDPATLNDESNAQNTPKWDSLRHIEVIFAVESAFMCASRCRRSRAFGSWATFAGCCSRRMCGSTKGFRRHRPRSGWPDLGCTRARWPRQATTG